MTLGHAGLVMAGMLAAGCTTASLEDAAPRSLMPAPSVAGAPAPASRPAGAQADTQAAAVQGERPPPVPPAMTDARNTGQFPNINVVPEGQTSQISARERAATVWELRQARKVQDWNRSKTEVLSDEELRRLGKTHAQETLKQIENE